MSQPMMSFLRFHGSTSVFSLEVGDHTSWGPQYDLVGKLSKVRLIESLAISQPTDSNFSLRVCAVHYNWKKNAADVAADDHHQRYPRRSSSLAPLEMQSSQGQLLMAMINERQPPAMISRVASQQLELLAAAAAASSSGPHHDTARHLDHAHQGVLYRRIADVKEKENTRALQDIIHALVACRILHAKVALPADDSRMEDATVPTPDHDPLPPHHLHHHLDECLLAIHSLDLQPMIKRHVAMVIDGKDHEDLPFEPHAFARVRRFEMGKMYAASVMYGYFLTRVYQRFKLDRGLQLGAVSMRPTTMEAYMEVGLLDEDTLHRMSKMRCTHSVDVIERHVEALFGKAPDHTQRLRHRRPLHDSTTTMYIQLGSVKSLILEALAFGAVLWDMEYNFVPLSYPLYLED